MGLLQAVAERLGMYRRFRYSRLYEWYSRLRNTGYAATLANDRRFYRGLFQSYGIERVFDIGANVGDKAAVFRELAAQVVCVEPDPDLVGVLRYRFRGRTGLTVEAAAIGAETGTAKLRRKGYSGFNTLSDKWSLRAAELAVPDRDVIEVPVTTLDRLIEVNGRPDYIKIDVEGYELFVVRGLSTPIRVISFECNLPMMRDETLGVIDRFLELNPGCRFNAREADRPDFTLPAPVGRDQLIQLVSEPRTVTYDLFMLAPDEPTGSTR